MTDTTPAPTTGACQHPAGSLVPRQQGAAITCHKNLGGCGAWFFAEARASAPLDVLTFAGFARVNRERCESPDGFSHPLNGWSVSDWFLAATGEFGEAANKAKKLNRYRDGIPGNTESEEELRAGLADEIADTVIYLDLLAQSLQLDLGTIVASKFDRTSEKIGAPHRLTTTDTGPQTGVERIAAERQRQIEVEGYDPVNDANDHDPRELEQAAMAYLLNDPDRWPWANEPKYGPDRIRELEKAGALIAAAIDVRLYCQPRPRGDANMSEPRTEGVEAICVACGHYAPPDDRLNPTFHTGCYEREAATPLLDVANLVRRHTHDDGDVLVYNLRTPVDGCLLCRALVDAGVLTADGIGADTRARLTTTDEGADHE